MTFVVLYIISCMTKHSTDLAILSIGRLTGGIATSILYSSFESWMISEHFNRNNFPSDWIRDTFYIQTLLNGIVAILAGFVSNFLYNFFDKSAVVTFDAAIIFLMIGGIMILTSWEENYGDRSGDVQKNFSEGWRVMRSDTRVLCVAISQSFFEAAMYIFVLMWTPTLKAAVDVDVELDIGNIFAAFMIAVMIGSAIFRIICSSDEGEDKDKKYQIWRTPEYVLMGVFAIAFLSLVTPIISSSFNVLLFGFLVFECCVGLFWPAISTIKSAYIPEEVRSTVMNYIRIPTNFLVVVSLFYVDVIPQFQVCCFLLLGSLISQIMIVKKLSTTSKQELP